MNTAKIIKDTTKTPRYPRGFHYMEYVVWADGEKTILRKERISNHIIFRTDSRTWGKPPDISATYRDILLDKVNRRYAELLSNLTTSTNKE
jgi:hypothetical protein